MKNPSKPKRRWARPLAVGLRERDRQIVLGWWYGETINQTAKRIGISRQAVHRRAMYLPRLFADAGCQSFADVAKLAERRGWLMTPDDRWGPHGIMEYYRRMKGTGDGETG